MASIAATPALGSTGLSPIEPISFTVAKGTIDDVTLTNPEGKVVVATISPDRKSWTVGEVLGFGKTYTVAGTATGTDGKQIPITGTYTTVGEDTQTRNTINPGDGAVVGVAAPISVGFGVEPEDRAAIQKTRHHHHRSRPSRAPGPGSSTTTAAGRWTTGPRTTGRPAPRCTSTPSCTG